MVHYIKKICCLIGLIFSFGTFAQNPEKVWFSQTGDTVLFFSSAVTYSSDGDSKTNFSVYGKKSSGEEISFLYQFEFPMLDSLLPIEEIPTDSLMKFNLSVPGQHIDNIEKYGFKISYKTSKIKDTEIEDQDYIQRDFVANISLKFNGKTLLKQKEIPISYYCPKDYQLNFESIATVRIWKMNDDNKFFVILRYTESIIDGDSVTGRNYFLRTIVENAP